MVEYKLGSSYSTEEVDVNRKCSLWDAFICFRLAESHGIGEDKNYTIKVTGTGGTSSHSRTENVCFIVLTQMFIFVVICISCIVIFL
jgi:hypothetical protein